MFYDISTQHKHVLHRQVDLLIKEKTKYMKHYLLLGAIGWSNIFGIFRHRKKSKKWNSQSPFLTASPTLNCTQKSKQYSKNSTFNLLY